METNTTFQASNADAQSAPLSKGTLWTGRIMSALPALFLFVDGVGKLLKPAPVVEGTRISREHPSRSRHRPAGLHHPLCDAAHGHSRCDFIDRLSWRRRRHACAGRKSALQPHLVPGLCRRAALGRALLARRTVARAHSAAALV